MLGVVGEQLQGNAFQCGPGRVDLGEDIDAVPILLDHFLDSTHLALYPPEPSLDLLLVFRITWHERTIPPVGIVSPVISASVQSGAQRDGAPPERLDAGGILRPLLRLRHAAPRRRRRINVSAPYAPRAAAQASDRSVDRGAPRYP